VSAPQRHSLCTRRSAIAHSPTRPHPSRDPVTVAKTLPRRGSHTNPRASPCPCPYRSRPPRAPASLWSLLHPESASCSRLSAQSSSGTPLAESASARLRLAPSAETRRKARDASCDESSEPPQSSPSLSSSFFSLAILAAWRLVSLSSAAGRRRALTARGVTRDHESLGSFSSWWCGDGPTRAFARL
jgi:hypothetical protein